MSRILFDQNVPRALGATLKGHEVQTAAERGWAELENGDLMRAAAEAGFALLVTCDQNLSYQQNMRARSMGLVVLSTNHWQTLRAGAGLILDAVNRAEPKATPTSNAAGRPGASLKANHKANPPFQASSSAEG